MQYRTTKRESFFLIIYTVYMIVLLLSQTAFEEMGAATSIFKYVRYLCYFLAALLILQDSYREKQIWGVAILGVLTVGTVVCSRQQYVHFIPDHDSCCKGSQCQNHRKADLHHTGSDAAVNRGHVTDRYHTGLYL